MTVTRIEKDPEAATMVLTADFDAPAERVWQLWSDPRQLERWWGPPSHPATVEEHDLTPGGNVTYYMTGPDGEQHRGWWRVATVQPPTLLEFVDGFADQEGKPVDNMPTTSTHVRLTVRDGGTRMELRSVFDSREAMEKSLAMGMEEGISQSVGQMDALLGTD